MVKERIVRRILGILMTLMMLQACSEASSSIDKVFQLHAQNDLAYSDIGTDFVLINYWASWCKPCVKEIPELNELDKHPQLSVFAYNFDRLSGEKLQSEADKFNLQLPMLLNDPASMFGEETPGALPATLVLNPKAGTKQWLMGAQTQQSVLTAIGVE